MALITRVSRLFRADLHAVLDRIEEPDVLLRQAVREMEDELARDEQHLKALRHERAQLGTRSRELERQLDAIAQELEVCLASDKDDLARAALRRRLETDRVAALVSRRGDSIDETIASLSKRVDENRLRVEGMRQKSELLATEARVRDRDEGWQMPECSVRDEDVEIALLREKQRRSQP